MSEPSLFLVAPRAKVVPFFEIQRDRTVALLDLPRTTPQQVSQIFYARQQIGELVFKALHRAFNGADLPALLSWHTYPPIERPRYENWRLTDDESREQVLADVYGEIAFLENLLAILRNHASFFPVKRTYVLGKQNGGSNGYR